MALFIQSGNALVSRVAQWVGAIPTTTGINATAFNTTTNVITTSASPVGIVMVGDFIGTSVLKSYTTVLAVDSTTITVSDIEDIWANSTYPVAILKLPTQSTSEIMSCIQLCELKMRTIELPALRSDPYGGTPATLLTDAQGMADIPADMNKPILFFQETPNSSVPPGTPAASMGPWIIYDRVGDREIIRRRMIDQLYVRPFGVPRVIRASFSEVGQRYVFTPNPGENVNIKAYYQRTFPFLFGPTGDTLEPIVQNNAALASFPEGYMYATLWAYYDKNKNNEEAQKWNARYEDAYGLIQDQNFKGKWLGGDQHLTSEFQPRNYRYSFK
jgi:hypothetical protein|tara:strand:- start:3171 stop:4157 length:987 start_codon:yes stop_codon:yes gene_type:complete